MPWSWHEEQMLNMVKTEKFEHPEFYRASGDCICTICNRDYYSHPTNVPFWHLTMLCNGDYVKL